MSGEPQIKHTPTREVQPHPLLASKLFMPPLRPDMVSRQRLIDTLNAGLVRKLTLVSASAGFGKTTLLSEWVRNCGHPVAWISLDQGDNDPMRFLAYMIAALQTVESSIGAGVLSTFQTPKPPPLDSVLTGLVNQITTIEESFLFILDDYHAITSEPIHHILTFLIDHLPTHAHLAIATRSDPPLPIARLRGQGELTELRSDDLRFTPEEATEFLYKTTGQTITSSDITALTSRTEGWIAGLQMAAISIGGRRDPAKFIHAFTGSNRYILDYLVEEVLSRQPEDVQTFLLQTSILEQLSGPLCDATTGQQNGQEMLRELEGANLFIVPLDDERRWYRYHHLFADLLRQRLKQTQGRVISDLHNRASTWYEQEGYSDEAIDHALAAEDYERAVALIEEVVDATMMRSELATLTKWVEALPKDIIRVRPRLCIYHAWGLLMGGHPLEAAESRVRDVEQANPDGSASGEITAFRALVASYQGNPHESIDLAHKALELLPDDSLFLRSLITGILGVTHLWHGEIRDAAEALTEAVKISRRVGNLMNTVLALCHLAELAYIQGKLHGAMELYHQALEAATDERGYYQPIAGIALIGLGNLRREQNELEAAAQCYREGIELSYKWGEVGAINGHIGLARIKHTRGDRMGAQEELQTARHIAERFDAMEMDDHIVALTEVRIWIIEGNLEAATRWARESGLEIPLMPFDREVTESHVASPILRAMDYSVVAKLAISSGNPEAAMEILESLLRFTQKAEWTGVALEVLVLQALAQAAQGQHEQAIDTLLPVLTIAEREGFARIFLDEGEPMAELLQTAVNSKRKLPRTFAKKLLLDIKVSPRPLMSEEPIETLSERELEVLQLMSHGLANSRIAQDLFISLNTVKTHLKNINSKLHVHNRTQAIARAKELNLL